eukprot:3633746-Prymnesium_polylepis.2
MVVASTASTCWPTKLSAQRSERRSISCARANHRGSNPSADTVVHVLAHAHLECLGNPALLHVLGDLVQVLMKLGRHGVAVGHDVAKRGEHVCPYDGGHEHEHGHNTRFFGRLRTRGGGRRSWRMLGAAQQRPSPHER